jgi:ferredoxin-NADP reductase
VWISGGIGLTPFLSMARSLGDEDDVRIDLYYAVENEEETYFLDEFEAIAERHKSMRVFPVIREKVGFLTADFIEETSGELQSRDFLICGPPAMIVNLRSQLIARGVPEQQIHSEEFGFARLGRPRSGPART